MRKLLPLLAVVTASAVAVGGIHVAHATDASDTKQVCENKHLLTRGAVEFVAQEDGNISLKDNTNIYGPTTDRALGDVVVGVTSAALQNRGESQANPSFDFLGPVGSEHFALPGGDNLNLVWPQAELRFEPVATPADSGFGAYFLPEGSTEPATLVNSAANDLTLEPATGHVQWAFSKPGIYTFDVSAKDGVKNRVNFVVGDGLLSQCETVAVEVPDGGIQLTAKTTKTTSKPQKTIVVNSQKVAVPNPEDEISNMINLIIKVITATLGNFFGNLIPILTQYAGTGFFNR